MGAQVLTDLQTFVAALDTTFGGFRERADATYALLQAPGTAFIVVIVSEMIAVNTGLGFRILEAREYFWSDKIIAGMISIGMLGLAIDLAVTRLNNHLLRWHRGLEN